MNSAAIKEFADRVHAQLYGHILPFWSGPALDGDAGGWVSWMANDGRVELTRPQGLIVNSRILWTFAAVHRAKPSPIWQEMAARAYDVVRHWFWDTKFGGAFWSTDRAGSVLDDTKKTYGQAFYIYALSEYHLAFGEPQALARAIQLFELIEKHTRDAKRGGYFEVCRRDWSASADSRLSEKDMDEKKSMNNHLHLLEAYTNLHRVWRDPRVAECLRELIALFQEHIIDSTTNHFVHFFDEDWNRRSQSYTFGHDIEGSWLLCEAAEALGDAALLKSVRAAALPIAEAVLAQGLDTDGGIFHEGEGGRIVDAGKEWWPQAEAVVGFLNAFQISGEAKFFEAARRVWDFIESKIVDRAHGDWFWRIKPNGKPDDSHPKISEWKGPYHNGRACLETLQRLEKIRGGGNSIRRRAE
jgi:mannobiose 2-epimerase